MDGLSTFSGWGGEDQQVNCIGTASFAVGEDGSLSGEASCTDDYRNTYQGSIEGSISLDDFAATATWTVDFGWQPFEIALEGDLTDDALTLGATTEIWQGSTFEVAITAARQ